MEQMPTALHDAPFLAIDMFIASAHTINMYPLDNILEGCSLCYHQVKFHLFKQYRILLSNQLSVGPLAFLNVRLWHNVKKIQELEATYWTTIMSI